MGTESGGDTDIRTPAVLARELRTALTPVLGYLDLVLQADADRPSEPQLDWIVSIERQLGRLHELNDELSDFCTQWRNRDRR